MTIHVDTALLLFAGILTVAAMVVWLILSTTGAETREWDQMGRAAMLARHNTPPPPTEVTVVVIPEGSSPSDVQRRIAAAIQPRTIGKASS
jgi:hypothetical protein